MRQSEKRAARQLLEAVDQIANQLGIDLPPEQIQEGKRHRRADGNGRIFWATDEEVAAQMRTPQGAPCGSDLDDASFTESMRGIFSDLGLSPEASRYAAGAPRQDRLSEAASSSQGWEDDLAEALQGCGMAPEAARLGARGRRF